MQDAINILDRQLQLLFKGAIHAMIILNNQGICLDINPAACQLFGLSKEELVNSHLNDWISTNYQVEQWQPLLEFDQQSISGQLTRGDGTQSRVEGWVTAHVAPQHHLVVLKEVSDRQPLELNLQNSEASLATMLDWAIVAIKSFRCHPNFIETYHYDYDYVSKGCETVFGFTVQEFMTIPKLWASRIHPEDWQSTILPAFGAIFSGQPITVEYRFHHKHGGLRWILSHVTSRWEETWNCWVGTAVCFDISHQKATEAILRQQSQREKTLNRLIRAIHNSLDLDVVFSNTIADIGELLQVDRVAVTQYLPAQSIWLNVANYRRMPELPNALRTIIPDARNLVADQLKQGQMLRIDDTSQLDPVVNQFLGQLQPGACLLIPLRVGVVWGAISLHHCGQPWQWQDAEVELAAAVADQLAIAIQQANLYQQVQQLNTSLEQAVQVRTTQLQDALIHEAIVKRITDEVRNSLEETKILYTVVQELSLVLDTIACTVMLYNTERTQTTVACDYTIGFPSAQGVEIDWLAFPDQFQTLLQGQVLQFDFSPPLVNPIYPPINACTILACPVLDNEGMLGTLWLFKPHGYGFQDQEIRLVQQVANQCAIGLRQSRLYQAVQTQVETLEHLNELKDDFLNTVSHDLRAPIANIRMAGEMLETSLDCIDERSQRYLKILKDECSREISLVNDLLDLSRLEMGRLELSCEPIDLTIWLPYIAEGFEERAREQQQQLTVDVLPALPILTTDPSCLQRIVTELLHNACKYTPIGEQIHLAAHLVENSPIENPELADYPHRSANKVAIQVMNTGTTIPLEARDRIFDKFYRIPSNDRYHRGGTGLGLALVKKLTEHLGGTIQLDCTQQAITFTIEFSPSLSQ